LGDGLTVAAEVEPKTTTFPKVASFEAYYTFVPLDHQKEWSLVYFLGQALQFSKAERKLLRYDLTNIASPTFVEDWNKDGHNRQHFPEVFQSLHSDLGLIAVIPQYSDAEYKASTVPEGPKSKDTFEGQGFIALGLSNQVIKYCYRSTDLTKSKDQVIL
jgi:hypothetical protein